MSDDVSVVVQDDSQFVEGLRLCLSYHIITSWDTPTSVAGRSSVIADNDGEEELCSVWALLLFQVRGDLGGAVQKGQRF